MNEWTLQENVKQILEQFEILLEYRESMRGWDSEVDAALDKMMSDAGFDNKVCSLTEGWAAGRFPLKTDA